MRTYGIPFERVILAYVCWRNNEKEVNCGYG